MTQTQARIFVSHSHVDQLFAAELVHALRFASADVWYDEHNLGHGLLLSEITRELQARSVFIVLLSKDACASSWVRDECTWAYDLYRREPARIILPVTVRPVEHSDFSSLLFIEGFKRIEAAGHQPYPPEDAIRQTLRALALVQSSEVQGTLQVHGHENVAELLTFGKALGARRQYGDAISCFIRVTDLDPANADAWAHLGYVYDKIENWSRAASAYQRALKFDEHQGWIWFNLASVELNQGNYAEALVALSRVIDLDPRDADAWVRKGDALTLMGRDRDAAAAYARARVLDPIRAQRDHR
jgi:tetratricopeptide (TPR) repeat protein